MFSECTGQKCKAVAASLIICMIAVSFSLFAEGTLCAFAETYGTVIGGADFREAADESTSRNIISELDEGTRVIVLGTETGTDGFVWYHISDPASGLEGYVRGDSLSVGGSSQETLFGQSGGHSKEELDQQSGGHSNEEPDQQSEGQPQEETADLPEETDEPALRAVAKTPAQACARSDWEFEAYLTSQGFPESYKSGLRALHAQYPLWKFNALHTGIYWSDAVYAQTHPVWTSLVLSNKPDSWKSKEPGAFDPQTGEYTVFDSGGWVAASGAIVRHYMDPRNSLDDVTVFQFLSNRYDPSTQNSSTLASVIRNTFLAGYFPESTYSSYSALLLDAGSGSGTNPLTLASMIINEQGANGGGGCISGTVPGYTGYYNFFNIGAYASGGNDAVINGLIYAKNQGWNTRAKSILGGAYWYARNYVNSNKYTLYLQRFNVMNGSENLGTGQYMTAIWGANEEGISLSKGYKSMMSSALTFDIPVYLNMPDQPCPCPGSESAGSWITIGGMYYYIFNDGTYASGEYIDGYWLDSDGRWTYKPKASWKLDSAGWWYGDTAGWYPKKTWAKIDTALYFFKNTGYMAKDEYISGYWLGSKGSWTYRAKSSWNSDFRGWWYEDTNGWYPKSNWTRIDDEWYYFDCDGYMLTGWYQIGGSWYYFGKDGDMAHDEWIEGYYVNGSGVWIPSA